MPNKLHLEVDGPAPCPVTVLVNGQLQSDVTMLGLAISANPPDQILTLERVARANGRTYYSPETRKITKATLTIEYEEAPVVVPGS